MPSYRAYQNDPIKRKAREAWHNMKQRCYNPKSRGFHRYGGRGIKVCDEWFHSFLPFYEWSLTHGIALDLTIDRIDNDGDYSPENCRWTKEKVQANNTSKNRFVEFNGERKTVQQWAEQIGITHQGMADRLKSESWTLEEALTVPLGKRKVQQPTFRKKIVQFSLDLEAIREWDSLTDAATALKSHTSNISRALKTGSTACGYRWKYAD